MRRLAIASRFLALLLSACGSERSIYLGGPILTLDAGNRVVEALGVDGAEIAAVGSEAEVRAWAGDDARVVELAGHALLPGFIDAHGHFPGEGIFARVADLQSPPVGKLRSMEELIARLSKQAERDDAGWILGMGYDDTLLAEQRHPLREDLDRVSTTRPVGAVHVSGHLAAVNSVGLARLGFDRATQDPAGGRIQRDPAGSPNGVLEENAMEGVMREVFQLGPLDAVRVAREGARLALSRGVTTVQVGYGEAKSLALAWLARLHLLPLRVVFWPGDALMAEVLDGKRTLPPTDPDWFRFGAVKLVADGSIQGYTANLSEPYFQPPGDDPSFRGYPRIARDDLVARVARFHDAGLQVAVHGNGDATIDDILAAFESAQAASPRADWRPIIVHAQTMRPDQLDRARALGAIPSFFVLHTYYWGDRHREIFLGEGRAARISPAATALAKGVRFTLHCDAPVVPMEPLRLVWAAVNRRTAAGNELGPEERISALQALRAVTIDAAFQHFEESRKGSLEPGKLADFAILDRSPLAVPPAEIDRLRVLETIIGGKTAYLADAP